ncbi:hypothetical protein E2562_031242 [Oryza meyeriana var. granulata]|uniref:Uncharacterized protein n=1 Tax=Oryza meyeriana var. granulata TaxID=110450 RepID=A0A6G1DRA2_9ORYZ|nr:hypothetical protein E2562_031242 [Oryza meyeriana var. granulata]
MTRMARTKSNCTTGTSSTSDGPGRSVGAGGRHRFYRRGGSPHRGPPRRRLLLGGEERKMNGGGEKQQRGKLRKVSGAARQRGAMS